MQMVWKEVQKKNEYHLYNEAISWEMRFQQTCDYLCRFFVITKCWSKLVLLFSLSSSFFFSLLNTFFCCRGLEKTTTNKSRERDGQKREKKVKTKTKPILLPTKTEREGEMPPTGWHRDRERRKHTNAPENTVTISMERVTEMDVSWINDNTHTCLVQRATKLHTKHIQQIQEIKIINCESGLFFFFCFFTSLSSRHSVDFRVFFIFTT